MLNAVKSKKVTRQDKEIKICETSFQKLCTILLYYCVFYILLNIPFYRHKIIMGG
jgi:hypothetical protein